jgi:molybdopterin converting factor small subunit
MEGNALKRRRINGGKMKIKVKVVGPLRQYVQQPQREWDLSPGTTVDQLIDLLGLPEKIKKTPITMLVNAKFVKGSVELKDGDELTLLFPVGGG